MLVKNSSQMTLEEYLWRVIKKSLYTIVDQFLQMIVNKPLQRIVEECTGDYRRGVIDDVFKDFFVVV